MCDSDDSQTFPTNDYKEIHDEIERCKKNPDTSRMFVSGWDDADEGVTDVKDPTANPVDHVLWAAENGELNTLASLLSRQPQLVDARDGDGYTPLHRAAYSNHVAAVSHLLSKGADVAARTQLGWTPLHSAANWNNYAAVARLLAAGADPNALSDGGQTPLHLVSAISHCKSTLLLLLVRDDAAESARRVNGAGETPEQLARGHGLYGPLFEMALPAAQRIKSLAFTCNPYMRDK